MRAIQMTPALCLQHGHRSNWMAHTPVGHDKEGEPSIPYAVPKTRLKIVSTCFR
jgi:hypothetical protein